MDLLLSQISTNFDSTYQWDLTGAIGGAWNALSAIVPSRGFITRVKIGVAAAQSFNFTGIPNNGTVKVDAISCPDPLFVSGNSLLLSNPYPSALDGYKFLTDAANSRLGGTLYFWTTFTQFSGTVYTADDYASWNVTAGTATRTKASTDATCSDSLKPTGNISSGQGFFADILSGTANDMSVYFKNSMRVRTVFDNSQFFKTTKANKTTAIEKNRIWLNRTNAANAFRQTAVGYVTVATNDINRLFNGEAFTDNEINIYTIVNDKNLVIQGRALPFDTNDLVPIGYAVTTSGNYAIAIDEVDGVFMNGQEMYLEDKLLNVITNLKNPYTFKTAVGSFNERFILHYTAKLWELLILKR